MSELLMDLVRDMHRDVGDRVQTEQHRRRSAGEPLLHGEGERQYVRAAIAQVLRQHAEAELGRGHRPFSEPVEDEIADAIFARMFGAGRLQRLLDDDSIENIDINGCDEVWISRQGDDYAERGEPVAASDAELVELIQTLGSYTGLSSRPFDAANPQLDLQLPDGSRLSALMAVAARPSVSIRRHRLQKVTLADLVGLGTMSQEAADFLRAVTQARYNIIVAGGR